MSSAIVIKNVSKSYADTKAVDSLDLRVAQGEFFGFLGRNGAGKTTTIRMLAGIVRPDEGTIKIAGVNNAQQQEIAQIIGVMPESRGFYDWMTGEEYLNFFAELYRVGKQRQVVESLLSEVSLVDRRASKIGTYSRGMKQRLGIARAIINTPQVLLLDEPTLGLDPQGQTDIQDLLKQLNQRGVTIFYSSHLLHEVADLCSKIAIIHKGSLLVQGSIEEIRKRTQLTGKSLTAIFLKLTKE